MSLCQGGYGDFCRFRGLEAISITARERVWSSMLIRGIPLGVAGERGEVTGQTMKL